MKNTRNKTRSPFLNALSKAFSLSVQSEKKGMPPADELIDMHAENYLHRRQFMGNILKTGIAIGAASFLDACSKVPLPTPDEKNMGQPKIVIIGAGIAGLNCAYQLRKAGYTASVYEAATRTGGRMLTAKNISATGLTTELGGEFIDSGHEDMLTLVDEFGLNLIDTLSSNKYARDSFYIDGRFYTEAEVIRAFRPYANRIERDINSLPETMTYDDHNNATKKFDLMSIRAYLDSIGMTGFLRKGIEVAYLTEYGLETDIQSSINFLYLFSPDVSEGFKIFGESDERYKVEGGNQSITNALHKKLQSKVYLGQKLVKIKQNALGYLLYFTNSNGFTSTVFADIVVSAIPFTILREVELDLPLPGWKTNAINNLGYGTNAKLLLGFNTKIWQNYKYSGYIFSNQTLQTGWDNSEGQPGQSGGYTVYLGGNKGVELGNGTPEQQAPKYLDELNKMWPGATKAFNGKVNRMHWPTYPLTKASYACYKVCQYTTIRGAEIKPVDNFFFAGEHCSSESQGFMNGGAETGRLAAEEILISMGVMKSSLKKTLS